MTSSYSQSRHTEDADVKSAETCKFVAENNVPYISCAAVDAIGYNQAEICVKHGFFTRLGGVSTDIYASLNGGLGSSDNLENVYKPTISRRSIRGKPKLISHPAFKPIVQIA